MEKKSTIILHDLSFLKEILGVNDANIRIFEEILGVKVFIRGNEIFLETDNSKKVDVFQELIRQLSDHIKLGHYPDADLIRALHESINHRNTRNIEDLKRRVVIIPNGKSKIFPRSINQSLYIKSIEENDMVFAIGPAGTGKTFLAIAEALKYLMNHSIEKLVLTRPVVEAGERLGFLPGDFESKINPYLRPLYDAMEAMIPGDLLKKLEETGKIEIVPLAYMRGRTLSESFIILDEAQNTTREQMKMFLTRVGERSKAVITGDITQIDLPKSVVSGLIHVIAILKNIKEIRFVFFNETDVVRNELVRKIVKAYEDSNGK